MIRPLQLGTKHFPINIIQGPLAGVSCSPFRFLTWMYGKPAFSCTEMISCKTLIHQSASSYKRYLAKDPKEGPVCFQLSASHPDELREATKRVTALGADLIDLNCGCPVKKIRGKGAGSSLLANPSLLYQMIEAMKQNTHLPVSIKIRVDGGSHDAFNRNIVDVVSDAGADFLTVHGRHWTEHYETHVHHDQIQFFVESLKIPVIGNGDIACVDSLRKMFATGCAGVMIGRAGVGEPWLIKKLIAQINNETFISPTHQEIGEMFITHLLKLIDLLDNEKFAILEMRKIAKYYARYLPKRSAFSEAVNTCLSLEGIQEICLDYFI